MNCAIFEKARTMAMQKGENLFPVDCIEILDAIYGKRLERIKPTTIFNMVLDMMRLATDASIEDDIHEAVSDYINC